MDEFIRTLIAEVKSQGVFDEFRFNCCLADVDTKPAYQNVRTRVETAVNDFLAKQQWTPDTNKVQLRERLRKHLLDSEVLDKGVDQIVDQVVNPKVATIFEPKIESIVYKYLGITPPPPPPRPAGPLLPAPPLPPYAGHMNGSSLLRVETAPGGLLPTDLEQISPDSDQATVKSDPKEESKDDDLPPGVDDERNYDEDTSPSYEPLSEEKPTSSKEMNNGLLNHSDSVNGVSQASQLSQVSSDSRLTIASSTESVAEAQQAAPANNRGELTANISEEAQMPKFSENSSDASVAVGEDNGSRQLHFDIKQDAITFEGTERRNSVSDTNGGPLVLSIEDAIMSEVKANIDDANHASIGLDHVSQPPLPPLPRVEPEPIQPPAPPDLESVQPPPPPPPPEIKEEPVQPPAPPPPEIKEEPVEPPVTSPPEIKPPAPTEVKLEPVQPPPPPELKAEPSPKVEPPPTPPPTESSLGSLSGAVVPDVKPQETESPQVKTDPAELPLKQEPQELPTVAEVKEDKPKVLAPPEEVEAPKEEITKASESTASPTSVSSQSKGSSRDKDKDKERRNHSHSDDKQRRRSKDRDRDRDRDRSRDKSHSKHSSSSSSKHSSSHSSSSKHRSSSSKNDKSSTSSSSKSHRESSSSSKRTSSTSSSRHESTSSSSHKKHKSSSSSSRSDRDKERDKEKEGHSRSHHSNSSSSSSSKRKDQDRGRDRDRHKSSSATTAPIQDDHNESKAKLNKRRSSDSNDEGKPPSSGGPAKSSQPEITSEKAVESVENGNGTNGNSNGGSGSGSNGACDSLSSGVVIVSDLLQQSATSFIELTAGSQSRKEEHSISKPEKDEEIVDQTEEIATQEDRLSREPQIADNAESVPDSPVEESREGDGDGLEEQPVEVATPQVECISANPAETETAEPSEESIPEDVQKEAVKPENLPAPPQSPPSRDDDPPSDELVTHFEENTDEFNDRLQLINKLIEDRQSLLSKLSADHSQIEADHIRAIRKGISKRRWSSEREQQEQEVGRESTPPPRFGSPGSSTSGSPTKRLRREEPKSSPTPSEASVNSKENEALEKQEHDALNARRFSLKLCQQQRYTNDDLYKPRPILSQRSRRRGLDSIL